MIVNNNNPKSIPHPPPDVANNPSSAIAYQQDSMSPSRTVIKEWGDLSEMRRCPGLLWDGKQRLKCRWGFDVDMMSSLYIGFGIMIVLLLAEIVLLLSIGQRIEAVLAAGLNEIDHKLADALASVMEKVPGFSEESQEFNPIQAAIGQLIANMADQNKNVGVPKIVERDSKGLFIETSD